MLRLSMEPVLAGVDLEGLDDTNEVDGAERVDAIRAFSPAELQSEIETNLPRILDQLTISADGAGVPLTATEIQVDDVPDETLPRESRLFLSGSLPEGSEALTVSWPAEYGVLILRQMDAEDGFTGYLTGGTSDPIAIAVWRRAERSCCLCLAYIPVGFAEHIVPMGLDHILFAAWPVFPVDPLGVRCCGRSAAFTLAHTVTLAAWAHWAMSIFPEALSSRSLPPRLSTWP